jgi:hypothetical protein
LVVTVDVAVVAIVLLWEVVSDDDCVEAAVTVTDVVCVDDADADADEVTVEIEVNVAVLVAVDNADLVTVDVRVEEAVLESVAVGVVATVDDTEVVAVDVNVDSSQSTSSSFSNRLIASFKWPATSEQDSSTTRELPSQPMEPVATWNPMWFATTAAALLRATAVALQELASVMP